MYKKMWFQSNSPWLIIRVIGWNVMSYLSCEKGILRPHTWQLRSKRNAYGSGKIEILSSNRIYWARVLEMIRQFGHCDVLSLQ